MSSAPLKSQRHVDQLLSNLGVKYKNERFIHQQVFPMLPVRKQSDLYRTYNRSWSIPETRRAIGGLAKEHQFEVSTATYNLQKEALKAYIPDTAAENYDITDLRSDMTEDLVEKIMMRKESDCASLFTSTAWSLGASLAADDTWLTGSASPIGLFDTASATVVGNSGVRPNYSIIPLDSFNALKNQTTIVDRIKYTTRELSPQIVGALIGVPSILIPDMYVDSGIFGASAATGAIASLWKTDFAFLGHKPASAGFLALSSGYEFNRSKPMVRRWREEERESEAIEVDQEYQFKVVASLTGYYINNTI